MNTILVFTRTLGLQTSYFFSLSIILEYPLKTQQVQDLSFGLFHIHTFKVKGSTAGPNINPRHSYS